WPVGHWLSQWATRPCSRQWAADLLPRVEAAVDVAGRRDAGILSGLNRHRRALAEGAVEQHALAGRRSKLMQHAAGPHIGSEVGVGGVQRTGDDAVLLALGRLAQIDQRHIVIADEADRILRAHCPAALRDRRLRD